MGLGSNPGGLEVTATYANTRQAGPAAHRGSTRSRSRPPEASTQLPGLKFRVFRVIRGKKDWDRGSKPKHRSLTADYTDFADAARASGTTQVGTRGTAIQQQDLHHETHQIHERIDRLFRFRVVRVFRGKHQPLLSQRKSRRGQVVHLSLDTATADAATCRYGARAQIGVSGGLLWCVVHALRAGGDLRFRIAPRAREGKG